MSEAPCGSDYFGELVRKEFVVLWVKLMQILWHVLMAVVQRAEWDHLVIVEKGLHMMVIIFLDRLKLLC